MLPDSVRSEVYSSNVELVTSAIGGDRKSKELLKKKYLEVFKKRTDYTAEEMSQFQKLINRINKGIKANK